MVDTETWVNMAETILVEREGIVILNKHICRAHLYIKLSFPSDNIFLYNVSGEADGAKTFKTF